MQSVVGAQWLFSPKVCLVGAVAFLAVKLNLVAVTSTLLGRKVLLMLMKEGLFLTIDFKMAGSMYNTNPHLNLALGRFSNTLDLSTEPERNVLVRPPRKLPLQPHQ